jgi:hypothetical protein
MFSPASKGNKEAKPVQEVPHTGLLFPSQRSTTGTITGLSSRVPAEEILVISSSHPNYLPTDVFFSLQRKQGGETGARGSSHQIVVSVPAFKNENHHLSLISGPGRGNPCNKFFTPYLFSRGSFSPALRGRREAKLAQEVLHN